MANEAIEKGFSSWKTSNLEWKKDWENQGVLITHNILFKTDKFNLYRTKLLDTFFWMKNVNIF